MTVLADLRGRAMRRPELLRAIVIAVACFVFFAVTQDGFATTNNTFIIVEGLVFLGLGALAFGVTMIAGELDLAVPSTATVAGVLALKHTDGILDALVVGILAGLVIGLIQAALIWGIGLHSVVITLGTSTALIGLAEVLSDTATVVSKNLDVADQIQRRIWIFSPGSLIAIGLFLVVGLGLQYSKWGVEVRAVGGGRTEAVAAGVPIWRTTVVVFVTSGVLSGILGVLVSLSVGSVNTISFQSLLLQAVAAALIGGVSLYGGRGTALGIAVGTLTLRFVISGMNLAGEKFFVINMAIGFLLLMVVLVDLFATKRGLRQSALALFGRLRLVGRSA